MSKAKALEILEQQSCKHYNPIRVYRVTPAPGMNSCCEKDLKMVLPWLEEASFGETIKIEILEMTPESYDALPEYMGP